MSKKLLVPSEQKTKIVRRGISSLIPNVVWDALKESWKWFRESSYYTPTVMGASTLIGTTVTTILARVRGLPPDVQGILIIAAVWLLILSLVFLLGRLKGRKSKSEDEKAEKAALPEKTEGATSALEGTQPQSMNELIRAAARDIEKRPCGADWLHAIAENDRTQIRNAVQLRGISLRNLMDDGIPKLEFVFSVYNKSVYQISIEFIDGYIRFEREKLKKVNLEIIKNAAVDIPPRGSGFFILEQTLLDSEARYILSRTDDRLFQFDELTVMIKGGTYSPDVVEQQLKIDGYVSLKEQVWRNYND